MKKRRTAKVLTQVDSPAWYVAKRVILAHGLTAQKFAEQMGVSGVTMHRWLNYCPSVLHVKMMADELGCSFFDFFDFSEGGEAPQAAVTAVFNANVNRHNTFTCPNCKQKFIITPFDEEEEQEDSAETQEDNPSDSSE